MQAAVGELLSCWQPTVRKRGSIWEEKILYRSGIIGCVR